ncbi:class I SAM-dependent methyltransferase [Aurantimonas sp. A3-2-R12]|uniref:class I SAM-dependent methyltransferase n=1 Tax=Aurantimonas sp. A3-2-R12 TaxID=3114362 RepID=UPI002E195558|nr:class I SAM-dependent methyltransferase [Aurantimonas sp. A3-2-R12]
MNCRHCGGALRLPFLDLGSAPPSNAYLTEEALREPEIWFPLRLLVCGSCWLVQTEDYAGRAALFTDDYAYFSSFSSSWLAHAKQYVGTMVARLGLGAESSVVEIAANDGYLLQYVAAAGIPCYGIEPTVGTAASARVKGLEIIESFFGNALAETLVEHGRQADLITANNVLAHVPDINDFVAGFAKLLKPSGVATFEFPHLLMMVRDNQFDTAYHEHYSYLSLTVVERIFTHNGLLVFDVEELPTHGGSLRVFAQRRDTAIHPVCASVPALREREANAGMSDADFYRGFQVEAERVKDDLTRFLIDAKRQGLSVGAYGAAAKGNTLLNFAGVKRDLLPYVVDKNPVKQGRFMPGSRIPIVSEDHLRESRPDRVLILPWNLADEVTAQLAYIRAWGGAFVTAVPRINLI